MHLVQSLEELIVSRNLINAIKFTACMGSEQRLSISDEFEDQYGSDVGEYIRRLISPSSSTSLLINMWLPTKILRLRVIERNFKELVPLELAHCVITCNCDEFAELCNIYNNVSKASLYAKIREHCIGQEPWKYLIKQWTTFNRGSVDNLEFLRERLHFAIQNVDGKLLIDTMLSANSFTWTSVCQEYECQYGVTIINALSVFDADSASVLSFANLFIFDQALAIAYLLNYFILLGDNDCVGIITALYFEKYDSVPMAYLQYGPLSEHIRAHFSSRYSEALKVVWSLE